jgi:hypothetical protein
VLILSQGTGHLIQLVTDATADIEPSVHYVDKIAGTGGFQYNYSGVGDPLASITTATTTPTITGATTTERAIERISYYNNHASTACTCTVQELDGTHTVNLAKCVLAAGETLYMNAAGDWFHLDSNGGPYVGIGPMATQAEMEAGTSTTVVVTPGRQHYHPGMAKFVCMTTGGATPAMQTPPSYNMTSITDAGAGRLTVTIATDFSSANWCCLATPMYSSTTITNATVWASAHIRSAVTAAGSTEINFHNWVTITSTLVDPTQVHVVGYGDQ